VPDGDPSKTSPPEVDTDLRRKLKVEVWTNSFRKRFANTWAGFKRSLHPAVGDFDSGETDTPERVKQILEERASKGNWH
jgi:hypothetical protein